jgi:hypothetical protein
VHPDRAVAVGDVEVADLAQGSEELLWVRMVDGDGEVGETPFLLNLV